MRAEPVVTATRSVWCLVVGVPNVGTIQAKGVMIMTYGSENYPPETGSGGQHANAGPGMKDEAARVGHSAAESGKQVAGTAKEEAKKVASEAGHQARRLVDEARGELTSQAGSQQDRLATGLRTFSDELRSMANNTTQPGLATDLVRQGADRVESAAYWLHDREPQDLVTELKSFARRRPGTFLAVAAGAGILAGRLTRSLKQGDGGGAHSAARTSGRVDAGLSAVDDLSTVPPVATPTTPPPAPGRIDDPLVSPTPSYRGDVR